MEDSHIEWTDNTFNPWWGCMKVSEGCKNCYAEKLDNRYNHEELHWGPNSPRKPMSEAYWSKPLQWEKQAIREGRKIKVFCASMADVFEDHDNVVLWRRRLFDIIAITPNLHWQLLTKRPENILRLLAECATVNGNYIGQVMLKGWVEKGIAPNNVWIGTSVENQKAADERIPHLLRVPAKVRFLSCEPLLSAVTLRWGSWKNYDDRSVLVHNEYDAVKGIDWVICGGESGHSARPMHPDWARTLRDQCKDAGIVFFFKQWGEWVDFDQMPKELQWDIKAGKAKHQISNFDDGDLIYTLHKVGKHLSGSLLDGKEYKQFPI